VLSEIIRLCKKYDIRLSPRLSQHFLHAEHVLDLEVSAASISENDIVLDIGAGFGFLTEKLAKFAKRVYAVEIDPRILKVLSVRLRDLIDSGRVVVIRGDILRVDLPTDVNKIVSNPPFHIISHILFRIARTYFVKSSFDLCVLIVQLDYAKKMMARLGEKRSRLSATIQYFAEVEILHRISRRNFFPVPEVDAAIVRLVPRRVKHLVDFEVYNYVITRLFNMPNRVLRRVIRHQFPDINTRLVLEELISHGISITKRIRELSNEELEVIAKIIWEHSKTRH